MISKEINTIMQLKEELAQRSQRSQRKRKKNALPAALPSVISVNSVFQPSFLRPVLSAANLTRGVPQDHLVGAFLHLDVADARMLAQGFHQRF